ncbi:TPA: hypothetical protein HA235_00960 [Candidatus Woesearchaeota archaeon]|nr:hypothetical protein [Candidatus Woesearchaeota archaeon]HIH31255.1 hypothetical protein [Candidatus Woesearchaeota archaeon]HIH54862.1 hypothetical protein [Candidatus Woesearchaeota archaeon]HIJ01767.1 hypothetical protein [Candidatus Woesearchaeota archaeon]HIJ13530.1 hypothetical protein [Candidatus Woesearchaeota archaeon]
MPVKQMSGPRCIRHQIECSYNCGWCGKPICDDCVANANGKKYCDKCWNKKQQVTPAQVDEPKGNIPRQPIRNVDHTLDPKIAEERRTSGDAFKKKPF